MKRAITFILAASMLAAALTGCGFDRLRPTKGAYCLGNPAGGFGKL